MIRGALTSYMDVAQMVLYAFWIFFSGLLFYLRREDRREGYPLEAEPAGVRKSKDFFWIPPAKSFHLVTGETVLAPRVETDNRTLNAVKVAPWPGAPLEPVGDPMKAEIGPGAYALRADVPERTFDGHVLIVPLRVATNYTVASEDKSPVGMPVIGVDGKTGGIITDVWVDRGEGVVRYYEASVDGAARHVLIPATFATVSGWSRKVKVDAILGHQLAGVPVTRDPDSVTLLEEEKIQAYFGAGTLYATPARVEPLI